MVPFTTTLHYFRRVLQSGQPWNLFVQVDLGPGPDAEPRYIRLVNDTRNRLLGGVWWQKATLAIELPTQDTTGATGQASIAVSNVSRLPLTYVEVDDEILHRPVTIALVHASETTLNLARAFRHVITAAEFTAKVAKFEAGHNAELKRVPRGRFTREEFGSLLPTGAVRMYLG